MLSSSHASAQKCCPFHCTLSSFANASRSSSVLDAVLSQFQLSSPLSISAALQTISQLCRDSPSIYLAAQLGLTSIGHLKPKVTRTELSLFSSWLPTLGRTQPPTPWVCGARLALSTPSLCPGPSRSGLRICSSHFPAWVLDSDFSSSCPCPSCPTAAQLLFLTHSFICVIPTYSTRAHCLDYVPSHSSFPQTPATLPEARGAGELQNKHAFAVTDGSWWVSPSSLPSAGRPLWCGLHCLLEVAR